MDGKKLEVAVKEILSGEPPIHIPAAVANPEAFALFANIPELK